MNNRLRVECVAMLFFAMSVGNVLAGDPPPVEANSSTESSWSTGEIRYDGVSNTIRMDDDAYLFDNLSRVVRGEVTSRGATTSDSYAYDAFGNLYRRQTAGPAGTSEWPAPVDWSTNHLDDLQYDHAGNVVRDEAFGHDYVWDGMKMLRKVSANGRQLTYIYTAGDERIGAKSGENWKWTLRDHGGRVLRELESGDTGPWRWVEDFAWRERALIGSERPAADGGRRHMHADHLGSTRLVTDHSGRAISQHDYLPFGVEITSNRQEQDRGFARENPIRFAGNERDFLGGTATENADNLDYMHARYYRALAGRFLTPDPATSPANVKVPQRWNRYAYTLNNPLKFVDPNGQREAWVYGQKMNVEPGFAIILRNKQTKEVNHIVIVDSFQARKGSSTPDAMVFGAAPQKRDMLPHYIGDSSPHTPRLENSNDPKGGGTYWNVSTSEVAAVVPNYRWVDEKGWAYNFEEGAVAEAAAQIGDVTYQETLSGVMSDVTDCAGYANQILDILDGTLSQDNFLGDPRSKVQWGEVAHPWWKRVYFKLIGSKGQQGGD